MPPLTTPSPPQMRTPHQMSTPAEAFAAQLSALEPIARLNASAIEAALEPGVLDHSGADAPFAPQAVALGVRQLVGLLRVVTIAALDMELEAAAAERVEG